MIGSNRHSGLHPADARWVLAVKLCILVTALLSSSVSLSFGSPQSNSGREFLFPCLAVLFLYVALAALWLRFKPATKLFHYFQVFSDALIVTGVIYLTGGSVSPFLFLYLPLVMIAALTISKNAALITSLISISLYSGLMSALKMGFIQPADAGATQQFLNEGLIVQMTGLVSGMVLVALGTSFLKSKLNVSYQLVEQSKLDLESLEGAQLKLIEELGDGVIILSSDSSVQHLNKAAFKALSIKGDWWQGIYVGKLFEGVDPKFSFSKSLLDTCAAPVEIEIHPIENQDSVKLRTYTRESKVRGNKVTLMFLEDLTSLRSAQDQLELHDRMARLLVGDSDKDEQFASPIPDFIGQSPVMNKIFGIISRVADSDATVLITGESGTGKELVARAIHASSSRVSRPFVAVNCGAIPETLIESELFGHKKGAFTGADSDSIGLFRQASGGTLFLDEIGELPSLMQTKLLRALQTKSVRPVGGTTDLPIDIRIVTATNRNLKKEIDDGAFREDLYYRLNVIGIHLPPLRERKDDIPLLLNALLKKLSKTLVLPAISPAAMNILMNYSYPGNVRELENIIERALILGDEAILPEHLPESVKNSVSSPANKNIETKIQIHDPIKLPVAVDEILADLERKYLELALIEARGSKKRAAELLGINFRSFRYRLQKHGLSDESKEANTSDPRPELGA